MKNSYDLLLFCLIFLLFNIFSTQQVIIADNFNLNDVEKLSDTEDAVISIENINIISPTELEIVFTDNVDISRASFFLLDMDYTLKVYPTSDPKFIKGIVSPSLVNYYPGCVLYHNVKDLYGNLIPQGVYVFTVILDTDIKEPSDPTEPVNPSEPTDPVIPDKPLIDDDTLVVDDIPDTDDQPVVTPDPLEEDITDEKEDKFGSVIFTEIMVNPKNSPGLSETEYIELYNRTESSIDLSGYKYFYNNKSYKISDYILPSHEYVMLCHTGKLDSFPDVSNKAGIISFPALNNSGKLIWLEDANGNLCDFAKYDVDWYNDKDKSSGGYSLERVSTDNLYPSFYNWRASTDPSGGTPGRENSVDDLNPDKVRPFISAYSVRSDNILNIKFSKPVNPSFMRDQNILESNLYISEFRNTDYPLFSSYDIYLNKSLSEDNNEIDFNTLKCLSGNSVFAREKILFTNFRHPAINDIIINELLFHPDENTASFIEVYNCTDSVFNLGDLSFSTLTKDSAVSTIYKLTADTVPLHAHSYAVITPDPHLLYGWFDYGGTPQIIVPVKMPALNTSKGSLALIDADKNIIDKVYYNKTQHTVSLDDNINVSLERIDPAKNSLLATNWFSGSEETGYATPGYLNSTAATAYLRKLSEDKNDIVMAYEKLKISQGYPESDMTLLYNLDYEGMSATIEIFNSKGISVCRPVKNLELQQSGEIYIGEEWRTFRSEIPGIYILHIECKNNKDSFSKRIVFPVVP